jgi:hypothetical protein
MAKGGSVDPPLNKDVSEVVVWTPGEQFYDEMI